MVRVFFDFLFDPVFPKDPTGDEKDRVQECTEILHLCRRVMEVIAQQPAIRNLMIREVGYSAVPVVIFQRFMYIFIYNRFWIEGGLPCASFLQVGGRESPTKLSEIKRVNMNTVYYSLVGF